MKRAAAGTVSMCLGGRVGSTHPGALNAIPALIRKAFMLTQEQLHKHLISCGFKKVVGAKIVYFTLNFKRYLIDNGRIERQERSSTCDKWRKIWRAKFSDVIIEDGALYNRSGE